MFLSESKLRLLRHFAKDRSEMRMIMEITIPMIVILMYLLVVNLIGFVLMFVDKKRAQNNQWRIKEATLFLSAAIGGSIGAMLGMKVFRHKTKHLSFLIGMPAIFIVQVALVIGYIIYLR